MEVYLPQSHNYPPTSTLNVPFRVLGGFLPNGTVLFFYPDAIPSRGLRIKGTAEITSHLVFNHEGIHLLRPQHTASIVLLLLLPWSMVAGGETRIEIVCGITHRGFITIVLTRTS